MCGIWGIVCKADSIRKTAIKSIIEDLSILSESRGKEASGIAGLKDGKIVSLKKAEQASKLIKTSEFEQYLNDVLYTNQGNFVSIGHSRLVTNGTELNNDNNQPVVANSVAIVHNGIIVNVESLWKQNPRLIRQSELDTEVLGKLIESLIDDGEVEEDAVKKSFDQLQGTASFLLISEKNRKLIGATNNGSLYCCRSNDDNCIIFASEAYIIHEIIRKNRSAKTIFEGEKIAHIRTNNGIVVDINTIKAKRFVLGDYNVQHGISSRYSNEIDIQKYKGLEIDQVPIKRLRRCTKCVLPETFPYIQFDSDGVCNYCHSYKRATYIGKNELEKWADTTKRLHNNKEYNAIVSFSGGRDSSYGLHYFVKELGLKPVAYSYDWGMVTDLARRNQARMCSALGVEMITVSADIRIKRRNIKKNILAWMKRPDLGMVPLFMAGDKTYFYYANIMKKRFGLDSILLASNPFETTYFKSGFCNVKPNVLKKLDDNLEIEQLHSGDIIKMAGHYAKQYMGNRAYINSSLLDTVIAALSYYMIPHNYFRLFNYIPWEEETVNNVLINTYDWELAPDTDSTWRIGDGTAPFYNYIYYYVCGFTENDTLRSNQIREGTMERDKALELVNKDNLPRWESLEWYFDILGLDIQDVLGTVRKMKKLYK